MKRRVFQHLHRKSVIAALVLLMTTSCALLYFAFRDTPSDAKTEMNAARSQIARHIILPAEEEPTFATVSDVNKLSDTFLKDNSKNGDQVLIYPLARKVYIYRPSIDRVVAMGPLTVSPSAGQIQGAKIQVWDGNGDPSTAQALSDRLKQSYPSSVVLKPGVARKTTYPSTIVIDLTEGNKYDLVSEIAQSIQGQRGVLPLNEAKPDGVDILIIVGKQ